ncbi:hypothetical protein HORM4_490041 [Vibrio harveyi]|nr:hypothetical protein HORM4_490041 [Vibrio harveyi]
MVELLSHIMGKLLKGTNMTITSFAKLVQLLSDYELSGYYQMSFFSQVGHLNGIMGLSILQ